MARLVAANYRELIEGEFDEWSVAVDYDFIDGYYWVKLEVDDKLVMASGPYRAQVDALAEAAKLREMLCADEHWTYDEILSIGSDPRLT